MCGTTGRYGNENISGNHRRMPATMPRPTITADMDSGSMHSESNTPAVFLRPRWRSDTKQEATA